MPKLKTIPAGHFHYGHGILNAVAAHGDEIELDELLRRYGPPDELFKGPSVQRPRPYRSPVAYGRQLVRYARELGFMAGSGDRLALTEAGARYVAAGNPRDIFATTRAQQRMLGETLVAKAGDDGIPYGAGLSVIALRNMPIPSDLTLGRRLKSLAGMDAWKTRRTLQDHGGRFRALVEDAGLVTDAGRPTALGRAAAEKAERAKRRDRAARPRSTEERRPARATTAYEGEPPRLVVQVLAKARGTFDLASLEQAVAAEGLVLERTVLAQVLAAIESGKHIILTGPPGTAKTSLARVVAALAEQSGRCTGAAITTATADWTTFETMGGLWPKADGTLEFREGHFLNAIKSGRWSIVDELNRSQFDQAFGQLFTALSGHPSELPHQLPGSDRRLALVPEGEAPPPGCDVLMIPSSWRILGTMNVFDKALLFDMSFALMRRFAFVEVPVPADETYERLIDERAEGDPRAADLTKRLLPLRDVKELGPAAFMDVARFLRTRIRIAADDDGQLLFEAFYGFLLSQFEGIDERDGAQLLRTMTTLVGPALAERLGVTLRDVLGLSFVSPAGGEETDEEPQS